MKTTIYVIGLSFLFACSKQQNSPLSHNSKAVAQVEKMDETDQRLAFDLLTLDEKVTLAEHHIDFCLGYFQLDQNQKASLLRTKSGLRDIYSSSEGTSTEMAALILDINQYFSTLDNNTLTVLFDSMATSDADVQAIAPVNPNNPPTACTCSTRSNWCSSSTWGPRIVCDVSKCGINRSGCGTLWSYTCNGMCNMFS